MPKLPAQHAEQPSTNWQEKYYSAVKELDTQEQSWANEEKRLFNTVLRLVSVYAGPNADLDKQISNLRESLNNHTIDNVLRKKIETLAENVSGRERKRNEGADTFAELLQRLSLPGELGAEVIGLRKQSAQLSGWQEKISLIDTFIKLLQQHHSGDAPRQEPPDDAAINQAKEILLQLIEWLPLPASFGDQINDLKSQLNKLQDHDSLKPILRQIATLINKLQAALQKELKELEKFLKVVTERLIKLEKNISHISHSGAASLDNTSLFNRTLKENVKSMQEEMQQETDIENIKQIITLRISSIEEEMGKFFQNEERIREEASRTVSTLQQVIGEMRKETQRLRKDIKDEQEKAEIDPLTNIPNRLAYNKRMALEYKRWQRYRQPLSLCIIDIDYFKRVNDTYGHKAGDKVLSTIAELCYAKIRDTDFLARYGGEEFVLLLPNTALTQARHVTENLRREIESCRFHYANEPVAITISCGVAEFHDDDKIDEVFSRADRILYAAKNTGRNRCMDETMTGSRLPSSTPN